MKSGDRVKWKYIHHLNSRSEVVKTKYGEYIRKIVKYKGRHQLAMVQFDGNKRVSRVPHCELEYERRNSNERRN